MEKYLRYEPRLDKRPPSCKRSRLSSAKVKGRIMAGCKSPSVDDILAFKNEDEIIMRLQQPHEEASDDEDRLSLGICNFSKKFKIFINKHNNAKKCYFSDISKIILFLF